MSNREQVRAAKSGAEMPVDLTMLAESAEQDPVFMRQVIDLYLTQGGQQIEALRRALSTSAVAEVEQLAHSLVGSSLTIGMRAIVYPLRQLESMAHRGQLTHAGPCLDSLVLEFGRIQSFLSSAAL